MWNYVRNACQRTIMMINQHWFSWWFGAARQLAIASIKALLPTGATWRHKSGPIFMITSSNGNIFRVTGPLCGEFTGPGEFPAQRPVTWSFDVFFDLRLNKRLSKQPWGWWFETPSWSLWRQCNVSSGNGLLSDTPNHYYLNQCWFIISKAVTFIWGKFPKTDLSHQLLKST